MAHASSEALQARIIDAAEAYHREHHTWPTRAPLAKALGVSRDVIRYHVRLLEDAGRVHHDRHGVIRVVQAGDTPIFPVRPVATQLQILAIVEREQAAGARSITSAFLAPLIPGEQRYTVSRQCAALVRQGKLVKRGRGYRLPDPQ